MTRRILSILGLSIAGLIIAIVTGWGRSSSSTWRLDPGRCARHWPGASPRSASPPSVHSRCAERAARHSSSSRRPWRWCWSPGPARPVKRPRLAAGGGRPSLRHHQRRSRDRPQHPQLRLPDGNRFHACLLRSHVRSASPRSGRSGGRVLDWPHHRPHLPQLRLRGRAPCPSRSRCARTRAKEYSTVAGFFRQYELIYIVAGRARHDSREDQLPEVAAGGCLSIPGAWGRSRTAVASFSTTCGISMR